MIEGPFGIALALALSYLAGSVPTGLWLGQWLRGVDIREHGSKNIGATNTLRTLGKPLGIAALAGDVAKGVVAVLLCARLGTWEHLPLACGVMAIVGHVFSCFVKFKGGKGVATSTGVFVGLAPIPTAISAVVFFVVIALSRMVSAASVSAALALGVVIWFLEDSLPLQVLTTAMALLVVIRHRDNIQRIRQGTESKLEGKEARK
jgi:glycerol-3-phosphate acyltransferase PlsY